MERRGVIYLCRVNLPSKLIEDAVAAFASLPGIGRKTALRLVLHLLNQEKEMSRDFSQAILKMREDIRFCKRCLNIADGDLCGICANRSRKQELICCVESITDLLAIENTGQFNGVYHVLGGVIDPMNGIGPEDLNLESLFTRIQSMEEAELILALSPTIEGDTTMFYISKRSDAHNARVTTLARGISFGGSLEYVDELTLSRSIMTRRPYTNDLTNDT